MTIDKILKDPAFEQAMRDVAEERLEEGASIAEVNRYADFARDTVRRYIKLKEDEPAQRDSSSFKY